jgi:hypothetical protein
MNVVGASYKKLWTYIGMVGEVLGSIAGEYMRLWTYIPIKLPALVTEQVLCQ